MGGARDSVHAVLDAGAIVLLNRTGVAKAANLDSPSDGGILSSRDLDGIERGDPRARNRPLSDPRCPAPLPLASSALSGWTDDD